MIADGQAHQVFGLDGRAVPSFFEGTAEGTIVLSPSPLGEFTGALKYLLRYPVW